jgi:methyltransferase
MAMSRALFLALLAAVAGVRVVEVLVSRRHQRVMIARGVRAVPDPLFPLMVAVHTGVLLGAAVEVILLRRPLIPALAVVMGGLFILANVVRWWVIRTLASQWNVQVMDSLSLGVVSAGPFRFVRHPNYAAVLVELASLPLIHTAWVTALLGSTAHAWVISRRVALEESVLLRDAEYRRVMAEKPRFLPWLTRAQVGRTAPLPPPR